MVPLIMHNTVSSLRISLLEEDLPSPSVRPRHEPQYRCLACPGAIWGVANLAQFTGQSTANIITQNLGSYAWALWISSVIALFSFLCAVTVVILDRYLRTRYNVTDHTSGLRHRGTTKTGAFNLKAIRHLPFTFWAVVLFAIFENAGVQSFVSISTYAIQSYGYQCRVD